MDLEVPQAPHQNGQVHTGRSNNRVDGASAEENSEDLELALRLSEEERKEQERRAKEEEEELERVLKLSLTDK